MIRIVAVVIGLLWAYPVLAADANGSPVMTSRLTHCVEVDRLADDAGRKSRVVCPKGKRQKTRR